jgi:serine/threonine protein kinase
MMQPEKLQDWQNGKRILGDYEIERKLGEGGMGKVYLARRLFDNRFFAVKTLSPIVQTRPKLKCSFLRELRTWIDIPRHSNVVTCYFFRTIEGRLAIFSEYIDGGTLKDSIHEKQLLAIDAILDAAIQAARGLSVAHKLGVVHRDVKPSNILLSLDGTAKITDFGLSRIHHEGNESRNDGGIIPRSRVSSSDKMTIAYCSPEQAAQKPLDHRTDIWSLAVSILEMFTGKTKWLHGAFAQTILQKIKESNSNPPFPPMPHRVISILEKCFQENPADRPQTMDDLEENLILAYKEVTGNEYTRKVEDPSPTTDATQIKPKMRAEWQAPEIWLQRAYRLEGRPEKDASLLIPERGGSSRAQAILDLEIYEMAYQIYEKVFAEGRRDVRAEFADLIGNKANVHVFTTDIPGALELFDRAIELRRALSDADPSGAMLEHLARGQMNKGLAQWSIGDIRGSGVTYAAAIETWLNCEAIRPSPEISSDLAGAYMNLANTHLMLGDFQAMSERMNKAIEIWERLTADPSNIRFLPNLGTAYLNKASLALKMQDFPLAINLNDRAISITERMLAGNTTKELIMRLSGAYLNKSIALKNLGSFEPALDSNLRAIELLEKEISGPGGIFESQLAQVYFNRGAILGMMNRPQDALDIYDKAYVILERLITDEGRTELTHIIAQIHLNKAVALLTLEQFEASMECCRRALIIYRRLIDEEKRTEFGEFVAAIHGNLGSALFQLGRHEEAVEHLEKATAMLEPLVMNAHRVQYAPVFANAYWALIQCRTAMGDTSGAHKIGMTVIPMLDALIRDRDLGELSAVLDNIKNHLSRPNADN